MIRSESLATPEGSLEISTEWMEEALAEHRMSQIQVEQLGLLKLSPALKGLMWLLRLYVLFMVTVVVVNVIQQMH